MNFKWYIAVCLLVSVILLAPIGQAQKYNEKSNDLIQTIVNVPYFYVDNNISNVDIIEDNGSHSNFTAQQFGPDEIMDILTEGNSTVETEGISEWLDCNFFDSESSEWSTVGTTPYVSTQDYPNNYIYEPKSGGSIIGWFYFSNTSLTGTLSLNISIYCNNDDGVSDDMAEVYVDYTGSGSGDYVGDIAQHVTWSYDTIILGAHTVTEVNNFRVGFVYNKVGGGDYVRIDHIQIGVSQVDVQEDNYELDLEVQWTNVDYSETNEELCIYGGTMGTENIRVDAWNGSGWENIFTDLSPGWNNVTVSSYLTSSIFTIRFNGGVETSDSTQDSWMIDSTLLHVWS